MSQNLEIEFKTLVTAEDFARLTQYFDLSEKDFFAQTNHYFDSTDFQLKKRKIGLRVRKLPQKAEITLKIPEKVGLLEINDHISLDEAQKIIDSEKLPITGNVYDKLIELHLNPRSLRLIGHLETKRAEKKLPQGLLALDESWYNQHHDFELELEVLDSVRGKADFISLLDTLNIELTPAPNKVQRMISSSNLKKI